MQPLSQKSKGQCGGSSNLINFNSEQSGTSQTEYGSMRKCVSQLNHIMWFNCVCSAQICVTLFLVFVMLLRHFSPNKSVWCTSLAHHTLHTCVGLCCWFCTNSQWLKWINVIIEEIKQECPHIQTSRVRFFFIYKNKNACKLCVSEWVSSSKNPLAYGGDLQRE